MSWLTNILTTNKIVGWLAPFAMGAIAMLLAMLAFNCGKHKSSYVTTIDTVAAVPDTVIESRTDTVDHYIAVLKPAIDGDSVQFYEYRDPNLSLSFNYRSGYVADLDYSIFTETKMLYIYDTTRIIERDSIIVEPPLLSFSNTLESLIQLGATAELAASPFPERGILIALEGSLRIDDLSLFVRPEYIYPSGVYVWGGVKWRLY